MAECLYTMGRIEEADEQLRLAASLADENPHALRYLAIACVASKRHPEALKFITRAAELQRDRTIYTEWGDVLLELNRPDEAITQYDAAVQIDPILHWQWL